MTTDYDPIAEQYQRAKQQPWRAYIECYTLLNLIGDLDDKTVLDLACGEGFYTRLLRRRGASRAVGIDLSQRMIELAREQEMIQRLGIEYLVGDAKALHVPETFDVVVAAYLLNYARSREELAAMCEGVAARTAKGGRFVSVNQNPDFDFSATSACRKYGFEACASGPLCEGTPITWTFHLDDGPLEIENYWLNRQAHEDTLHQAGFSEVRWHRPQLDPKAELAPGTAASMGEGYWDALLAKAPFTFLECAK